MDLAIGVQIATFASVIFAAISLLNAMHVYRRQMNAQLFVEFTRRYEEIMQAFPNEGRGYRLHEDGEPPEPSPELSAVVLRYLNLSSEEFYLWKRHYLATDIWTIWEAELGRTLRSPLVRREWSDLRDEFASYPEFVEYVEKLQSASSAEA